jgi:hypothetical protein
MPITEVTLIRNFSKSGVYSEGNEYNQMLLAVV